MIWLVWRRQRVALLLALTLLALTGITLVVARLMAVSQATDLGVLACLGEEHGDCTSGPGRAIYDTFRIYDRYMGIWLVFLPPIAGLIAAAGLFAGEYEQRTVVFALTQSTGRIRWWATGVFTAFLPVAAGVVILTAVAGWAQQPFVALYRQSRLGPPWFDTSGVVPVGYTLLAFAIAVAGGILVRSALATVVITVGGFIVIFALTLYSRYDYLPDQVVTVPIGQFSQGWEIGSGLPRSSGFLDEVGNRIDETAIYRDCTASGEECARQAGATQGYLAYQPDSYFWSLQAIIGGITVAIAVLLLGLSTLRLRRDPV